MRPNLRQKSVKDDGIAQQPHHLHTCQVVRSKATDQARVAVARAKKTAQDWLQAKPKNPDDRFFSLVYSNAKKNFKVQVLAPVLGAVPARRRC